MSKEVKINNTFTADNINDACINPYDVKFDLWNIASKDYTAEEVNVIDAMQQELISIDEAAAIMEAAGMSFILSANCTDPMGFSTKATAKRAERDTPAGLEPTVEPVRDWLASLL